MLIKMNQIYKNLKEENVYLPYKASMRLWKFKLQDKKFINLHIPNKEKLIYYLQKHQPIDVWFTNGLFLNARNLEKSSYKIRLVKKNLVFDLDDVYVNEVNKLLDFLKPYLLELDYIINTSKNSYQVSFKNDYDKEIVDEVIEQGIKIDKKIYDEKRVIRCPLTYHHSGYFINFIDSPLNIDDQQESPKDYDLKHHSLKEEGKKENLPNPSPKLYIPTYINGINEKAILYLRFKIKNLFIIKSYLRDLDTTYRLGFGILRIYEDKVDFICPRVFEIERLKKIYRDNKSGIRYFNVSDKLKESILWKSKSFNKFDYSHPHIKFINKFIFPIDYDLKQIGPENPVLIYGKQHDR